MGCWKNQYCLCSQPNFRARPVRELVSQISDVNGFSRHIDHPWYSHLWRVQIGPLIHVSFSKNNVVVRLKPKASKIDGLLPNEGLAGGDGNRLSAPAPLTSINQVCPHVVINHSLVNPAHCTHDSWLIFVIDLSTWWCWSDGQCKLYQFKMKRIAVQLSIGIGS